MKTPEFATEGEQAKWIYENREQLGEEFAQAMRDGRTSRPPAGDLRARVEAAKSKAVNIRLAEEDLQLARELAEREGLPYQTFIKSLLHKALLQEAKRA